MKNSLRKYKIKAITATLFLAGCTLIGSHYLADRPLRSHQSLTTISMTAAHVTTVATEIAPVQTQAALSTIATGPCATNGNGKLLLISIAQQHLWACAGTTQVNESAVTTGASAITNVDMATPIGTFHIQSMHTAMHLRGTDANGSWDDAVNYWIPFDGAVGFHDASWQTIPFGSPDYVTGGSHGCVHLPLGLISWVYNWAAVGTTVRITS